MSVQRTEVDTDRLVTIPNALSVLRLIGVPVFLWLLLVQQADTAAAVLLMLSGVTDWADGYLARRLNQISALGKQLDPIADRLYILATLLGLGWRGIVPWALVVLLLARDVVLAATLPALRRRGMTALPVHYLGKAATFCLLYAFPLVLLGAGDAGWQVACRVVGWAFVLWGTLLYWWAGTLYLWQVWVLISPGRRADAATGGAG